MSTPVKIGAIIIGICLLLLISLVIIVKIVVTPEKVRDTLVPMAEKALARQVEIGEIKIGLLSGVSLNDLIVSEKDTGGEFVSVKTLALHYQLLALLGGNLVIDQVLLEQPKISVVRNPDGSFNFSDLLSADKEGSTTPVDTSEPSEQTGSSALDLLVKDVSIRGGELQFVDRLQNPKTPYRFLLDQLDFHAQKITLDGSFPLSLSAQINGSKMEMSGAYDISQQAGAIEVKLQGLDLLQFSPYYRDAVPGLLSSALLGVNLELKLLPQQIDSSGTVSLENIDLLLNDLPEAELKQAKVTVQHALEFQLEQQKLQLSSLKLDFNGIKVGAEGSVNLAGTEPQLALAILLDKFDVISLMQGVPAGLVKDYQSLRPSGLIDGRVELAGVPSAGARLLQSARLQFSDLEVNLDSLQAGLSGGINLAAQKVASENLLLKLNDQQLKLELSAENLFGKIIKGQFKASADQLDVNRIMPAGAEEEGSEPALADSGTKEPAPAAELGPFDLPLDMDGQLRVNNMLYKKLNLQNVAADLTLKDNRLKIAPLRGEVAGGEIVASADVNLAVKGLEYQGKLAMKQSKLVELVAGLVPQAEQSVTGLLQWDNSFSGKGTVPKTLLKALQLKGELNVQEGQVTGSPLLKALAGFLGSPDLEVLSFAGFNSQYDMRDGLAQFSGDLDSSKAKLKPEGTLGVDGSLDLGLDARLAPEVMQRLGGKSQFQQALTDENGWTMLPLKIKGSLNSPKFGLDSKALQKQATGKIKQEVSKKILEKIAPAGAQEGDSGKNLLDGTLKKFFGN